MPYYHVIGWAQYIGNTMDEAELSQEIIRYVKVSWMCEAADEMQARLTALWDNDPLPQQQVVTFNADWQGNVTIREIGEDEVMRRLGVKPLFDLDDQGNLR